MGHAGLSKYKQSAHNTQGKVIGISLCLCSSCGCWAQRSISTNAIIWMPGILSSQSGFSQHANNVNKCQHSRKETSPQFLFFYLLLCLCLCCYISIACHSFILFDFKWFKFGKTTLCTNCKTSMTWTNKFSMIWAPFLFSCKKSTQNTPFFRVCCTKCKPLIRQYMNKECCFSELSGNEA